MAGPDDLPGFLFRKARTAQHLFVCNQKHHGAGQYFLATDEYDISSTEDLRKDQEAVLLAFGTPSLKVGDRYVTLQALGDGAELGSAFVKFTASWFDQRPGYHDPEDMNDPVSADVPKMEDFEFNNGFSALPTAERTN